jgi:hypothetical protein
LVLCSQIYWLLYWYFGFKHIGCCIGNLASNTLVAVLVFWLQIYWLLYWYFGFKYIDCCIGILV